MTDHARTIRVTTFTAAPGQLDDLVKAAASNARDASGADGCFGAQVLRPDGEADVVAVISRWRDQDALKEFLDAHEDIAHRAVAGLIAAPGTSTHYLALPS
jgi:heme-degrading monooxygenase HmoA